MIAMNGGIMTLQLQKTQTEDAKEWNLDDILSTLSTMFYEEIFCYIIN